MTFSAFFLVGKVYEISTIEDRHIDVRIKNVSKEAITGTNMRGEFYFPLESISYALKYNKDPFQAKEARAAARKQKRAEGEESNDISGR